MVTKRRCVWTKHFHWVIFMLHFIMFLIRQITTKASNGFQIPSLFEDVSKHEIRCQLLKVITFQRLQTLLVFLILNGTAKTKLAIFHFSLLVLENGGVSEYYTL